MKFKEKHINETSFLQYVKHRADVVEQLGKLLEIYNYSYEYVSGIDEDIKNLIFSNLFLLDEKFSYYSLFEVSKNIPEKLDISAYFDKPEKPNEVVIVGFHRGEKMDGLLIDQLTQYAKNLFERKDIDLRGCVLHGYILAFEEDILLEKKETSLCLERIPYLGRSFQVEVSTGEDRRMCLKLISFFDFERLAIQRNQVFMDFLMEKCVEKGT